MMPNRQTAAVRHQTAGAVAGSECATAPVRLTEWRTAVAHALPPHGPLNQNQNADRRGGQPSSPEAHAAYRAGRCVDCKAVPYSAGRPRCNRCHAAHMPSQIQRTPPMNQPPNLDGIDTQAAR